MKILILLLVVSVLCINSNSQPGERPEMKVIDTTSKDSSDRTLEIATDENLLYFTPHLIIM